MSILELPANSSCDFIEQIHVTRSCRVSADATRLAAPGADATRLAVVGSEGDTRPTITICGSSTDDPLLLRAAVEQTPDISADFGSASGDNARQLIANRDLRRLALVRIPGGKSALIHSIYSQGEDRDPNDGFFSHVLIHPALHAREALATWDSIGWATRPALRPLTQPGSPPLAQPGSPGLGRMAELPTAGPINDQAVTSFLKTEATPEDLQNMYPKRLRTLPERRRRLLHLVLRGCQLALNTSRTTERQHFYLAAEPELIALLLYAASRILPDAFSAKLTFSTCEPFHRLGQFKQARVIGTCPPHPAEDFDEEFYTTYGYALNTFTFKSSPELAAGDESEIDSWIERVAQGEWKHLDEIHQLVGHDAKILSLGETKQAYQLCRLLMTGKATSADLFEAMKTPWGPAILRKYREHLWPQLWEVLLQQNLTDPLVGETFADLIVQHLPEVENKIAEALAQKNGADWKPHWRLLRLVFKDDIRRLRETLLRVLPAPPFPADFRIGLLEELSSLQMPKAQGPARFQALLTSCSSDDLDLLARSKLDREWFVWALCHALVEENTASEAARHLHAADDALIRTFWEQFLLLANEGQRRAILGPLFPPTEAGARFLIRSLKNLSWLPPETLLWLLDSLGAFGKERIPFWTAQDNLRLLLRALQPVGEAGEPIWQRLCSLVDADVIMPGDAGQQTLLLELWAAESQPGFSMPTSVAQALRDWMLLRERFEKASAVPVDARQQVIEACGRLRLDPCPLLAGYFQKFIGPKAAEKEVLDDFTGFFHSFFPDGKDYHDYGARLIAWLRIVDDCPAEAGKDRYQSYYLHQHVPAEFRWRLAQDMHGAGKLLDSVHDNLPKPTEIDWLGVPHALLFQLTGVRVSGDSVHLPSLVGLFPTVVASFFALVLCGLFLPSLVPKQVLFLPAVVMLADGIALQSMGLALGTIRGRQWRWSKLRGIFWRQLRAALAVGVIFALMSAAACYLWGASWNFVGLVVIALLFSLASVPLISLTVPLVLQRFPLTTSLSNGILARAAASIAAVFVYLVLARALIG
jgi:hypothetical protein